jgi:hypothetical protein
MDKSGLEDKVRIILYVIILVAIAGAVFGLSQNLTNWIIGLLVSILIGVVLSAVAGSIVEAFTGDFLKKIFLNVNIYGDFSISISVFAIVTFIVKISLFGL